MGPKSSILMKGKSSVHQAYKLDKNQQLKYYLLPVSFTHDGNSYQLGSQ